MNLYFKKSVKAKVILTITLVIGVIALVGFLYFPGQYKSAEMEAISDKIFTISKIASFNVGSGLYFNDPDAVVEQLESILNIPDISYIIVENQKDSIFYSHNFDVASRKNYSKITPDFISSDGSTFKIKTPIIFNSQNLGYIYIGYSLETLYSKIAQIQRQIMVMSVILFLLGVVIAYLFAHYLLKPLLKIVDATKEITTGNLRTRAPVMSEDEVGYLAESFNEMVDKLAESKEELETINKELEHRVEDRTKDLEEALNSLKEAKDKAEKSDELKTEFLAQMSHEIRTPINVILSFTSLINYELSENVDSELQEGFDAVESAGRRLIRTIDLILNMSEIQTNSYECHNKQINIYSDILQKLVKEYSQVANIKGINLILNNSISDHNIYADEYTVTQIFQNLIDNAMKYTSKGKVELDIDSDVDNNISVIISDTGIGISEEFLINIFNPFRQEEQGYSRSYDGNGLGLALVKKYCDLNNAEISVESEKGKGTKFIVTFKK